MEMRYDIMQYHLNVTRYAHWCSSGKQNVRLQDGKTGRQHVLQVPHYCAQWTCTGLNDVQRVHTLSIQTFKARAVSCKDDKSVDFSGSYQGSDTDYIATCNNLQVPIRDSVLTKLLSEGLVNAAATVMLACVGPTHAQLEQSTASLHFAAVAQRIRMKPVMRLDPHDQVCSR
jgi:hypothetical protein